MNADQLSMPIGRRLTGYADLLRIQWQVPNWVREIAEVISEMVISYYRQDRDRRTLGTCAQLSEHTLRDIVGDQGRVRANYRETAPFADAK